MKEGGCLESRFVFSQFDLSTERSMRSKHDLARPQVGEMHASLLPPALSATAIQCDWNGNRDGIRIFYYSLCSKLQES